MKTKLFLLAFGLVAFFSTSSLADVAPGVHPVSPDAPLFGTPKKQPSPSPTDVQPSRKDLRKEVLHQLKEMKPQLKEMRKEAKKELKALPKAERKAFKKERREQLLSPLNEHKRNMSDDDILMLVLLILLALLIPPLCVFIVDDGPSQRFWINLIITLIAVVGFYVFNGLLWLIAVGHAIYVLLTSYS